MATAWISVLGLYSYDNTIFDDMVLPTGVDDEILIANILAECGELEIIAPSPASFKTILEYWSKSQLKVWEKLYETTTLVYNPIWNKDGTRTEKKYEQNNASGSSENKMSAFNAATYQNANKNESSGSNTFFTNSTFTEKGNIGVTTTQEMIRQEREVSQFSIYDYIVASFKSRFCIGVY